MIFMAASKTKQPLHDFHFVMPESMKEELKSVSLFINKSLSSIIREVLMHLIPVLKRKHDWAYQQFSKYFLVSKDKEEKRVSVHTYIPEALYKQLKLMHNDLNMYSIAQLVRYFLRYFLDKAEKYGDKVLEELSKIFAEWEKSNEDFQETPGENIRHLRDILNDLDEKKGILTIYNKEYEPVCRLRT